MSWAIAANWLAVLGLALLTFGTGAQALANLAEFKSVRAVISEEAIKAGTLRVIQPVYRSGGLRRLRLFL